MADAILCACLICGNSFKPLPRKANKFCSLACYHDAQRKGLVKVGREAKHVYRCHQCGVETKRQPSQCRDGSISEKVFCSRACYDESRSDRRGPCVVCSAKVPIKGSKYCSWKCRVADKKPEPCTCKNCGCLFTAIKVIVRPNGRRDLISYGGAGTCSAECHNLWIRNNPERKRKISAAFSRELHPGWQGGTHREGFRGHDWEEISEKARDRAKRCCEHCGMEEAEHLAKYRQRLHVHHDEPFHQQRNKTAANRLANLVALCRSCHTKADWKWRKANPVQGALELR